MEVEWTLGSVLAESGPDSASDPMDARLGHGVDTALLLMLGLLTAGVGVFCCWRVGGGRKVSSTDKRHSPESKVCPGLLAAGLASKAALLVL